MNNQEKALKKIRNTFFSLFINLKDFKIINLKMTKNKIEGLFEVNLWSGIKKNIEVNYLFDKEMILKEITK